MLRVTALPLVNGYRLVAATSYHAPCYHWSLMRNQQEIGPRLWSAWPYTSACFRLTAPLAPGRYQVQLTCFANKFDHFYPLYHVTASALVVIG